ncbi:unnamed protein product [Pleuronectes platessa]|uniref:Uncharacterized protein n=1 Tax=Pleuronectes platessa TaxID=8262 RepID=A0A9N7U7W1_PLEPL|nr:unnamed protein product [Pleuronectes platessa]
MGVDHVILPGPARFRAEGVVRLVVLISRCHEEKGEPVKAGVFDGGAAGPLPTQILITEAECGTQSMKAGHRRAASDRHFKPLLPSPPCGLADNGNLIGERA